MILEANLLFFCNCQIYLMQQHQLRRGKHVWTWTWGCNLSCDHITHQWPPGFHQGQANPKARTLVAPNHLVLVVGTSWCEVWASRLGVTGWVGRKGVVYIYFIPLILPGGILWIEKEGLGRVAGKLGDQQPGPSSCHCACRDQWYSLGTACPGQRQERPCVGQGAPPSPRTTTSAPEMNWPLARHAARPTHCEVWACPVWPFARILKSLHVPKLCVFWLFISYREARLLIALAEELGNSSNPWDASEPEISANAVHFPPNFTPLKGLSERAEPFLIEIAEWSSVRVS